MHCTSCATVGEGGGSSDVGFRVESEPKNHQLLPLSDFCVCVWCPPCPSHSFVLFLARARSPPHRTQHCSVPAHSVLHVLFESFFRKSPFRGYPILLHRGTHSVCPILEKNSAPPPPVCLYVLLSYYVFFFFPSLLNTHTPHKKTYHS